MKANYLTAAVLTLVFTAACEAQDPGQAAPPSDAAATMAVGSEGEPATEPWNDGKDVKPLPWGQPYQPPANKSAEAPPEPVPDPTPVKKYEPFPDPFASCKHKIEPGDGVHSTKDLCWGPPSNWCASGGHSGALTQACSPDGKLCCEFGSACVPCGWTKCGQDNGFADCPKALDSIPACAPFFPRAMCLDDFPMPPR